jgi:branched-chain amino acid transport system ATP-binding protein
MVEQNATKALEVSHWALVLDLGQKRFEGPAADIAANPQVRQLYLGQGP